VEEQRQALMRLSLETQIQQFIVIDLIAFGNMMPQTKHIMTRYSFEGRRHIVGIRHHLCLLLSGHLEAELRNEVISCMDKQTSSSVT